MSNLCVNENLLTLSPEAIGQLLSESPQKNGSYNYFIKLSDKIGLKLSKFKKTRDNNYKFQTLAAKEGLGPETYGTIDDVKFNGRNFYGYYTEVVKVNENWMKLSREEKDLFYNKYQKEIYELRNSLDKIGFDLNDDHGGNFGYKNGQLIFIDFDQNARGEISEDNNF